MKRVLFSLLLASSVVAHAGRRFALASRKKERWCSKTVL